MRLRLLLPNRIFAEKTDVLSIVSDNKQGAFGLLPQRLDCATALVPGILTYVTKQDGTVYVAVDEGVLVKTGDDLRVSVRRAVEGTNLTDLHDAVKQIVVLLALSAGLLDPIPLEKVGEAEAALRKAAADIAADVTDRLTSADKLSDADKKTILDVAKETLARFVPKPAA